MDAREENGFAVIRSEPRKVILLSSYGTGAQNGKNLGSPGYSHDIVMQLYAPLLKSWGDVISIADPWNNLESAIVDARERGLDPIHLSVIPCQDAYLSVNAPNVLMPAWEFPDIPDHDFGLNPQNDWTKVASKCDALIVSGPFTSNAFRKSGVKVPIHHVQVPTPESYFELKPWRNDQTRSIKCTGYSFQHDEKEADKIPLPIAAPHRKPKSGLKKVGRKVEKAIRDRVRATVNDELYRKISNRFKKSKKINILPARFEVDQLDLSGVVYTSIFNPNDGRKNWQDLITSFLVALGERDDATLVVKLVTRDSVAVAKFLRFYRGRDIDQRCRVIVTSEYLTDQQLVDLTEASTYYIQTTKAEGNCLPLMNFLAAGRPGISPCHSAISDYFDDEIGFVADSNPEPAAWPHDPHLRTRSTWGRLVWTSMVDQIRKSYQIAKDSPETYNEISQRSRERLRSWASPDCVQGRLIEALDDVYESRSHADPVHENVRPAEVKRPTRKAA
ncbi:glycosyltransferase [Mariniblastus fucicola]|uniref:Glycosyl transferases group 1 n=1 Tax=Mariniblastus fucicola TaxID=980251 RepID=A0A5B9PBD5_9BACT|nr:glycosyltransferase [Mariniblastus fucicola]QEG23604.1 hypothetical protein MFFC18_35050 [Mariniblastus fucicola]